MSGEGDGSRVNGCRSSVPSAIRSVTHNCVKSCPDGTKKPAGWMQRRLLHFAILALSFTGLES